jgi:hypothetical protein
MALFRVHAVDLTETLEQRFFDELGQLFMQIAGMPAASPYDDVSVYWWTSRPVHVGAHEPLVWIVASRSKSLIKKIYGKQSNSIGAGLTAVRESQGNISEIYLDADFNNTDKNRAIAAFHELMHNKSQKGNEMHGAAMAVGKGELTGAGPFSYGLNSADRDFMAPLLKDEVRQWMPPFK